MGNDFLGRIANRDQSIDFVFPYKAFAGHGISEPVHKAGPEFGIVQNDRERPGSASLGDDKGLRKLVDCAHTARHDHICPGILYEHELADEEIAESTAGFDILVATLLVGQFDMQANRNAVFLKGALVRGFHRARPPARYDAVAGPDQLARYFLGILVFLALRLATGRNEN